MTEKEREIKREKGCIEGVSEKVKRGEAVKHDVRFGKVNKFAYR